MKADLAPRGQVSRSEASSVAHYTGMPLKTCSGTGAFYLRLIGKPLEVYQYLEPLYNDYRLVRLRSLEGHFQLTHVDEVIDEMLRNEYLFDIALPRIPNR